MTNKPGLSKLDTTETEIGLASYLVDNIFAERAELQSCLIVVSGPDRDGEIVILAGAETHLPPDVARKLAVEILRRLGDPLAQTPWTPQAGQEPQR